MISKERIKKARYIIELLSIAATVETADNGKRKPKRLTVTRHGSAAVKGERCAV